LANVFVKSIGEIFHPIFLLFAWGLAGIYSVIPNYGVAIAGLTIAIMLALTPVTIKSTKSMIAMQRLQPEMKKLQAKFKGPENREQLNQEMMKLYKENGTSPFGACLPSLLQMPFLIILYSLIRGLSYSYVRGNAKAHTVITIFAPRYLNKNTKMYHNLVSAKGQMHSIFGMDLSSSPFTHHGSDQAVLILPYLALIGIAVFLQYFQMKQMNSRNPQAAQANPQMQQMQKFFPLIFGLIYLRVPAGATIYMVVSSAMRIGTQEFMFRSGMVTPVTHEREIGGAKPAADKPALDKPPAKPSTKPGAKPAVTSGNGTGPIDGTKGAARTPVPPKTQAKTNGKQPSAADQEGEQATGPKSHPRSRSKRTRKAR
jgi:YidC/Oxa1 family membrane protein insertase